MSKPAHAGSRTCSVSRRDTAADEHSHIGNRADPSRGDGVLLWFVTDGFSATTQRVEAHAAEVLDGPLENPNSHLHEVWLRGPEGDTVVVPGPGNNALRCR